MDLWYVEDGNAVPPVHVLQPRRGRYVTADAWTPVERALLDALGRAAGSIGPSSSTTQVLTPAREDEEIKEIMDVGASVGELETRRALGRPDRLPGAVHAFFR